MRVIVERVHSVEQGEGGVRELEALDDQGGDHPIGEDQFVARAGSSGALPFTASAFAEPELLAGSPRLGELS
ncbi:hypothetical protein [Streptomyces werraensis]|uniref:hypothetical protein n=1 Tax=Streptomyces werraensis TaxID=68284 RepID=UPI00380088BA